MNDDTQKLHWFSHGASGAYLHLKTPRAKSSYLLPEGMETKAAVESLQADLNAKIERLQTQCRELESFRLGNTVASPLALT